MCVDPLELLTPRPRAGQKGKGGGKGANAVKTCWNCGESGHMSSQCPKKKVRVSLQDTIMVGSVGSYFDVGSVSESDPRAEGSR